MHIFVVFYLSSITISLSYVNSQHTVAGKTVSDWLTTCKLNFHQLGDVALSQVLRGDDFCEGIVCVKDGNNYGINVQHCQEVQNETKICTGNFSSFPTCCNEELCLDQNNSTKQANATEQVVESKEVSSNEDENEESSSDDQSSASGSDESKESSNSTTTAASNTVEQNLVTSPETNASVTEETNISVPKETNTSVTEEANTSVTEETNTSVTEEANTSVAEETNTSITEEANTSVIKESTTIATSDDNSSDTYMPEGLEVPDALYFTFTLGNKTASKEVNTENSTDLTTVENEEISSTLLTLESTTDTSELKSTTSEQNEKTVEDEEKRKVEVLKPQSNQTLAKNVTIQSNDDYITSATTQISELTTKDGSKQDSTETMIYHEELNIQPTESATLKHKTKLHKSTKKGKKQKKFKKLQKKKAKQNPHYYFGNVETTNDYERKCKKDFLICLSLFLHFIADDGNDTVKKQSKRLFFLRKNSKSLHKSKSNFENSGTQHSKVTWSDLYNEKTFRTLQKEEQYEARRFYKEDGVHYNNDLSEVNAEEPFSRIPKNSKNGKNRRTDLGDPRELDAVQFNFK